MCAYNRVNGTYASQTPLAAHRGAARRVGLRRRWWSPTGARSHDRVAALARRAGPGDAAAPRGQRRAIVEAVADGRARRGCSTAVAARVLRARRAGRAPARPPTMARPRRHHALARGPRRRASCCCKNDGVAPAGASRAGSPSSASSPTSRATRARAARRSTPPPVDVAPRRGPTAGGRIDGGLRARVHSARTTGGAAGRSRGSSPPRRDVVVVFPGLPDADESEGFDRTDIDLPAAQIELIGAVVAAATAHGRRALERRGRATSPWVADDVGDRSRAACSARPAAPRSPTCCSAGDTRRAARRDHPAAPEDTPAYLNFPGDCRARPLRRGRHRRLPLATTPLPRRPLPLRPRPVVTPLHLLPPRSTVVSAAPDDVRIRVSSPCQHRAP